MSQSKDLFFFNKLVVNRTQQFSFNFLQLPDHVKPSWREEISPLPSFLQKAIESRQAEFLAGRYCAKKSIEQLGVVLNEPFSIDIGSRREPIWPDGFVGSISHKDDFVWSMVAKSEHHCSLGIDVENIADLSRVEKLKEKILSPKELIMAEQLVNETDFELREIFSVIFSIKESFYKFAYPIVKKYIGFQEVSVCIEQSNSKGVSEVGFMMTDELIDILGKDLICRGKFVVDRKLGRVQTVVFS